MNERSIAHEVRLYVVRPALQALGDDSGTPLWSPVREDLAVGTAAVESAFAHIDQRGRGGETGYGPAVGMWQIEKATMDDMLGRWLRPRPELAKRALSLSLPGMPLWEQLAGNMLLGAAVCALRYRASPVQISTIEQGDVRAYARAWVVGYNAGGAGTEDAFIQAWNRLVA